MISRLVGRFYSLRLVRRYLLPMFTAINVYYPPVKKKQLVRAKMPPSQQKKKLPAQQRKRKSSKLGYETLAFVLGDPEYMG